VRVVSRQSKKMWQEHEEASQRHVGHWDEVDGERGDSVLETR